ncbi:DUF5990 family protein [Streptomyces phaeolivaceus]|nr:DUF5990 family protein [Streptomyces phaeolivaceus]
MRIRIDAVDLPGLTRPDSAASAASSSADSATASAAADGGGGTEVPASGVLHVAVQRRDRPAELLEPRPGDASSATWTLECTASTSSAGTDIKGPYVQDRLGRRFVYLSWGTVDESGTFTMFRRAKLMLDVVPADVLAAAARDGLLVGRLGLTDARGGPLCGRVEPPHITWTAPPPM